MSDKSDVFHLIYFFSFLISFFFFFLHSPQGGIMDHDDGSTEKRLNLIIQFLSRKYFFSLNLIKSDDRFVFQTIISYNNKRNFLTPRRRLDIL